MTTTKRSKTHFMHIDCNDPVDVVHAFITICSSATDSLAGHDGAVTFINCAFRNEDSAFEYLEAVAIDSPSAVAVLITGRSGWFVGASCSDR